MDLSAQIDKMIHRKPIYIIVYALKQMDDGIKCFIHARVFFRDDLPITICPPLALKEVIY